MVERCRAACKCTHLLFTTKDHVSSRLRLRLPREALPPYASYPPYPSQSGGKA